jgi:hypothetical protein
MSKRDSVVKAEKRSRQRTAADIELTVRGAEGGFAAQTVDISRSGALLWITDERFVAAGDQTNMVRFSERVAQEFGETMTLEFEGGRSHEAEVVRVTRMKGPDDKGPMLVACRFARALSPEETLAIGLKTNGAAKPAEAPATPPPPPPEAAPATERPSRQRDHVERRAYPRVDSVLYAEVQGDYGTYRAYALNVSASGALFTINDPQFSTPAEPDQLVLYTKRMAFHFRAGMIIRFLEADVKVEADVVRVSERIEGGELMIVIGAKFRRQLTEEECNRLEVELPAVGTAPYSPVSWFFTLSTSPVYALVAPIKVLLLMLSKCPR